MAPALEAARVKCQLYNQGSGQGQGWVTCCGSRFQGGAECCRCSISQGKDGEGRGAVQAGGKAYGKTGRLKQQTCLWVLSDFVLLKGDVYV